MAMSDQYAFVVMSFQQEDDALYRQGIQTAVESLGIQCKRVDRDPFTGRITDEIIDRIKNAYFVIGELSHERPNCYYELGYAHALGKTVLMLIDDQTKIHFDLKDFNFIVYKSTRELKQKLRDRICGAVLSHERPPSEDDTHRSMFGRSAVRGGRLLTAQIRPVSKTICEMTLRVVALPRSKPLVGNVRFYLHESYNPAAYTVKAKNGAASIEIGDVGGAFTVGARTDNNKNQLELDLTSIPGGMPHFYRS